MRRATRRKARPGGQPSWDDLLAQEIKEIRRRQDVEFSKQFTKAYARDRTALHAWDALAYSLKAGKMPAASVRAYFIKATRRLNWIEDLRNQGKPLQDDRGNLLRDVKEGILWALSLERPEHGLSSPFKRAFPERWDRIKAQSRLAREVVLLVAEGTKRDMAYDEVAKTFKVSRSEVVRAYLSFKNSGQNRGT